MRLIGVSLSLSLRACCSWTRFAWVLAAALRLAMSLAIMLPYILVASERGMTAAMIRFRRPGMWVARLALRAARPSARHWSGAIGFIGSLAGSKPLAPIIGVSVAAWRRKVEFTPTLL